MHILGLGGTGHSFSACIVTDGTIQIAVEEERLNKVKHSLLDENDRKLARCKAGEYCLNELGIPFNQIELVVTSNIINKLYYSRYATKTILMPHHLSHASSTYYTSPYSEAAILVVDGCGGIIGSSGFQKPLEVETISTFYGQDKYITDVSKITGSWMSSRFPYHSIGEFYFSVTAALGFSFLEEGKTMGLAPYGTDEYVKTFEGFYSISDDGQFIRNQDHVNRMDRFMTEQLHWAKLNDELFKVKANLAYAAQFHIENVLIQACNTLYKKTHSKNLCLAGGVFLNSSANYRILKETPFENVYVFPQSGDTGIAIGSALYGYHIYKDKPLIKTNQPFSPYLGRNAAPYELEQAIQEYEGKLKVETPTNIYKEVARHIAKGAIIGWSNGRSEVGPRALGNRSILADPRSEKMKEIINSRIKHREWFRPFAPVVLAERQQEYFALAEPSYYMLFVAPIHEEKQKYIPAVTHVDGTGRVQTVSKESNKELYNLLQHFYELTGVPVLLNTSFNDNGKPIVETPHDSIKAFMEMDLDYLVINNQILSKIL
ncbi:carbamoyltransferase [Paenibacillus cellulosilyticus]|uniref:Carbamoyltransferase n=1 Tax=Paenibacillus cellulosilyticus TaxID=375489 RepID=A0A2V2YUS3_9BACL|nr:carbamoyltransferase C-terminal domain-containing protein [Paenibacillus cellulosilyticus]PWW03200.1 carbamoyltransferase [Paenibacillus cellulosilyticus]QKS43690.1 hypothetical protein HUB94_04015 [Paenibacillus cellulosilyticus]